MRRLAAHYGGLEYTRKVKNDFDKIDNFSIAILLPQVLKVWR